MKIFLLFIIPFRFLLEKRKLGKENHNGAVRISVEQNSCAPRNQDFKKESLAKKTNMGRGA